MVVLAFVCFFKIFKFYFTRIVILPVCTSVYEDIDVCVFSEYANACEKVQTVCLGNDTWISNPAEAKNVPISLCVIDSCVSLILLQGK